MPYKKRTSSVKERITDALCALIREDQIPYQQLTIQNIVDKAEVCRNSFYRNYDTIEDILIERFQRLVDESNNLFNEVEEKNNHNLILTILQTCYNNRDFLLCFYKAAPNLYINHFTGIIIQSNTTKPIHSISPEEYYVYAGRAWIFAGLTTEWLKRGCDVSIQQITETIESWAIS